MIFSFLIMLWIFAKKNRNIKAFRNGFLWGTIVFSIHFIWLYQLLIFKSYASLLCATVIYLFVVLYGALLCAIWWKVTSFFVTAKSVWEKTLYSRKRTTSFGIIFFVSLTFLFFVFIHDYSLFFLGTTEGYPFLDPFIPLTIDNKLALNRPKKNILKELKEYRVLKILYLEPIEQDYKNSFCAITIANQIYNNLSKLNLEKYCKKYQKVLVVFPETAYPFALNKQPEILQLWNCVLPQNAHLMIGSQYQNNNKLYQVVYWINSGQIKNFYVKKHRVPFTEKVPNTFKKFSWAKSLFLQKNIKFSKPKKLNDVQKFKFLDDLIIYPKICSELFYCDQKDLNLNQESGVIFAFVNDSWFCNYFKRLMRNKVLLLSSKYNIEILYIPHDEKNFITIL